MLDNPGIKIELTSHADSRGDDIYNLELAEKKASAAVDYIIRQGISSDRIEPRGYGESRLLNKCFEGRKCSEEEHQLNRRTEIEVIQF